METNNFLQHQLGIGQLDELKVLKDVKAAVDVKDSGIRLAEII